MPRNDVLLREHVHDILNFTSDETLSEKLRNTRCPNKTLNTSPLYEYVKQSSINASMQNLICDVISEKVPYCGRNSVFLDQLFLHFCDSFFIKTAQGAMTNVSFRCSLATNTVGPDQTPRITTYDICPAISHLLLRWRHINRDWQHQVHLYSILYGIKSTS